MACLGLYHAGIENRVIRTETNGYLNQQPDRVSGFKPLAVKLPNRTLSTAIHASLTCDSGRHARSDLSPFRAGLDLQTEVIGNNRDDYYNEYNDRTSIESPRVSETLDELMQNSVTEIVKNITQAPLLVQIYSDGQVTTEKSPAENNWRNVDKQRSAVIVVKELQQDSDPVHEYSGDVFDGAKAFGVLIQGRIKGRDECKSRCYLLKTSSVNGGELGHICTHFCLMKVQSFHKSVFEQFNDCWLLP
ncbi:uncharacterized protein [Rutidosis leptorrhynchoides]|uniref:uncharacterized protein n=1 Tax=Rutidosis leptorrhynchoides TaxID=125765 RepID=UPI003A9A5EBF